MAFLVPKQTKHRQGFWSGVPSRKCGGPLFFFPSSNSHVKVRWIFLLSESFSHDLLIIMVIVQMIGTISHSAEGGVVY